MVEQPIEPALDRGGMSCLIDGKPVLHSERRHSIYIPCQLCVTDGSFCFTVRFAPNCRPPRCLDDIVRIATALLGSEQLPHNRVVPVPGARSIQWNHQCVGSLERFEHPRELFRPSTESHIGPDILSRTEVRIMKLTSGRVRRESNSDRT